MELYEEPRKNLYISSFFGGAVAGVVVDVVLYPLDTIKTRLQSAQGFQKAGGFRHIYKGIGPQVLGSCPQAAMFFLSYESFKYYVIPHVSPQLLPLVYMTGASISEMIACLIRVPIEVVKQRRQTSKHSSLKILLNAYNSEGFRKGLYRGFGSMLIREIPFTMIQFPILEHLKTTYQTGFKNNIPLESWEVAICGAIAGGISAAVTTPLDVVKTRIMLADKKLSKTNALTVSIMFKTVYKEGGVQKLFAGFVPRVLWITIGGYIFFGMYDLSKNFCTDYVLSSR